MCVEFSKNRLGAKSFSVTVKVDNRIAGEALFYEKADEPGVFGERVDIKEKFRGQGLATMALQEGDKIVHNEFPGANRRFLDINKRSYKRYTDGISDDQLIEMGDKGILFKP
jgi:hypothetical protein